MSETQVISAQNGLKATRVVEETPSLKLRDVRPILEAPLGMPARVQWSTGDEIRVKRLRLLPGDQDSEALKLEYYFREERYQTLVPLARTPANLGGSCTWFICPVCAARRRVLYRPKVEPMYACRVCHGLKYSTRLGREARYRRAKRIVRACDEQLRRPRLRATTRQRLHARRAAAQGDVDSYLADITHRALSGLSRD